MKPENRIFSESLNPQSRSSTAFLRKSTAWLRGGLNPPRSTKIGIWEFLVRFAVRGRPAGLEVTLAQLGLAQWEGLVNFLKLRPGRTMMAARSTLRSRQSLKARKECSLTVLTRADITRRIARLKRTRAGSRLISNRYSARERSPKWTLRHREIPARGCAGSDDRRKHLGTVRIRGHRFCAVLARPMRQAI